MSHAPISLAELNQLDRAGFVAICGPLFEHSPWIAERTFFQAPFASREDLHAALCATLGLATNEEKLGLVRAHPDLVGRLAREGALTRESTGEQAAAGLTALTADEVRQFDSNNVAYRAKFNFPFVICARENKKEAILAAFPERLQNSPEQELATALIEIGKIARLRLWDAVQE
jgi:2-oxo-4-hydroxy-4-carboxy-5-ureidoimidazoline decarboxylase